MSNAAKPETRPMKFHKQFIARGECGCPICGKPLKENEKRRSIHIGEGGASIMRADLPLADSDAAILSTGPDTGDMGWFDIGSTCAKKLGLEWSKELPPLQPLAGILGEPRSRECPAHGQLCVEAFCATRGS